MSFSYPLTKVSIHKHLKLSDFLRYLSNRDRKEIGRLSRILRGRRILHVNATSSGGGVAEILKSFILYLNALKISSDWYAIAPNKVPKIFFHITNKIHDSLQGAGGDISINEWNTYEKVNKRIARQIDMLCKEKGYDVIVIHDPQPLVAGTLMNSNVKKIFVSHIDNSHANMVVCERLKKKLNCYDYLLFSNIQFINDLLDIKKIKIYPPAIDPISSKQRIVNKNKARHYLSKYGIPEGVPLITQISRFDIWKNPMGLVNAFRIVQETFPKAHLALVGFHEAKDNPEASRVFKDIYALNKSDKSMHMFFDPESVDDPLEVTVMAQNGADVVVQNSIKEGFGLTVTEAMWKGKSVIGGPAHGIKLQIENGKNGFIAKNHEELAILICKLLINPKLNNTIGRAAKRSVLKKYLMPRLVLDHMRLYKELILQQYH